MSPTFPCANTVVESFSSDPPLARANYRKGAINVRCRQTSVEFALVGLRTEQYFRLDRTVTDLTSGVWEILLVVIELGMTGLKKTGLACFLYMLGEMRNGRGMV